MKKSISPKTPWQSQTRLSPLHAAETHTHAWALGKITLPSHTGGREHGGDKNHAKGFAEKRSFPL